MNIREVNLYKMVPLLFSNPCGHGVLFAKQEHTAIFINKNSRSDHNVFLNTLICIYKREKNKSFFLRSDTWAGILHIKSKCIQEQKEAKKEKVFASERIQSYLFYLVLLDTS
jgi:hypothetical protein